MGNDSRRKMGTIWQTPGGKWCARIQRGCKIDGSPRVMSKTHATKEEAEEWIVAKCVELDERPDLGAGVTLRRLWVAYKTDQRGKLANSTLARYEGCMTRHWLPAIGGDDASLITPQTAQRVLDTIPGRTDAKQCKSALSSVLTWAVRHSVLQQNPIRDATFTYPGDGIAAWEDESIFDDDPFAAIERTRNTWGAHDVLRAFDLLHGAPLEPVWLAMVGAGARLEEAFALRKMDVRRTEIEGSSVTQLALHHALNAQDGRHRTKTRKSARIVAMLEPFGERLWKLVSALPNRESPVCAMSVQNYGARWRGYFAEPPTSKHVRGRTDVFRGCLHELPYIPISRMRATHETLMQEAGVLDSVNAAMHGHSQRVSYQHYQQSDATRAAQQASSYLQLVG